MRAFRRWAEARTGRCFTSYDDLWRWSITDLDDFWGAVWEFFSIADGPAPDTVTDGSAMPATRWFPEARLNYAERLLEHLTESTAILARAESGTLEEVTGPQLRAMVARVAAGLRQLGVQPGDRVCAIAPNALHTVVAMLAAAAVGAVWASVGPEYGAPAVLARFGQLQPTVLFATEGYRYGGRWFDLRAKVDEIVDQLPTIRTVVDLGIPGSENPLPGALSWDDLVRDAGEPTYAATSFSDPLWTLFSSGTTGAPKALVHSHGGILLEHAKALGLHYDLRPGDRLMWFTTTSWMMWNYQISALLAGATLVLFDGHPDWPKPGAFWQAAADLGVTVLGTSPGYVQASRGLPDGAIRTLNLSSVRTVGTTGAPLGRVEHAWLHELLPGDVLVAPVSGGTDICSGFVGPNPELPEVAGTMQCRMLGAAVVSLDDDGLPVTGHPGELVISKPMPSMPVKIWGDDGSMTRYRRSYFDRYPGMWRHGDWLELSDRGTAVIHGRSDATLNRGGVRMGTSEFYEVLDALPFVADSTVVEVEDPSTERSWLCLFVSLRPGAPSDSSEQIGRAVRSQLSPRHTLDRTWVVPSIPRTSTGKRCEVLLKTILAGAPRDAAHTAGVAESESLDFFYELAVELGARTAREV